MRKAVTVLMAVIGLAGCQIRPGETTRSSTSEQRANRFFQDNATAIEQKEPVTAAPSRHVLADRAKLSNGTIFRLWVSDPGASAAVRSRCFYLDEEYRDGGSSGSGGCGAPTEELSLGGNSESLVGSVGLQVARVRVSAGSEEVTVAAVGGYFLVPPKFTYGVDLKLTFTLLDAEGKVIGVAHDVSGPGSVKILEGLR